MDHQTTLTALNLMVKIRTVEELIAQDFIDSKIFSFLHLTIGQEATAVGVSLALQKSDFAFGNHRSHGHYLAKGGDFKKMVLEVYGDSGGCCRGLGGSMHMLDRDVGFVGSTPILGSVAPIACGIAASKSLSGAEGVVVAYIGDGAAEEGAFYESINLAGLMKAPLIFVLEDNRYSVASKHSDRKARDYDLEKIIVGLGGIYRRVNGQNVDDVFNAMNELRRLVISDGKVGVLHADVLRHYGHSGPMKELKSDYRVGDDFEFRERNDPINITVNKLVASGENKVEILEIVTAQVNRTTSEFKVIRDGVRIR